MIKDGNFSFPVDSFFIGVLEGIFEGEFNGKITGRFIGDYSGSSPKGKLSGSTTNASNNWQFKIRTLLDDDQVMENRQLRTLWQLQIHKKKNVWVMPGVPFVTLMLIGYILYLLFGNLALLIFM